MSLCPRTEIKDMGRYIKARLSRKGYGSYKEIGELPTRDVVAILSYEDYLRDYENEVYARTE